MIIEDLGRIPMSQHLAATLARAASYADAQQHASVTLEHLLLALAEDPDASVVLRSSNVDLARLAGEVSTHIGRIEDRRDPNAPGQVLISPDLKRILEAAAAAARQGRRPEINGAIVLAAIVGDGKSTAANLLRIQGLTFEQAIRALQRVASAPRTEPAPQPAGSRSSGTTEDILANARERVQSRSAQGQPRPSQGQVPRAPAPSSLPGAPINPEFAGAPGMEAAQPSADPRSPVAPQWEPAVPVPQARDATVPHPPVWTGPPPVDRTRPSEEPGFRPVPTAAPAGVPPPLQTPPGQRTQPPSGLGSAVPPPPLKPHSSVPFQNAPVPGSGPPGASMPSTFGQPPNRTGPPAQQPRAPQPGASAGGVPTSGPSSAPRPRRPGKNVWVAAGQFVENIPRKMRVGVSMVVEARIGRRDVKAIAEGMDGGAAIVRHEITVTKAMSVRLRSPEGGFFIESSSPETQWIEGAPGFDGDYASWRWTITPRERGKQRLQLLASARTVGDDGLTAETALPDQMIEVKVTVNYAKSAARLAGWMTAAVIGGVLARFGESMFVPLISILRGGG
jgi:hypothetical protein